MTGDREVERFVQYLKLIKRKVSSDEPLDPDMVEQAFREAPKE